MKRDNLLLLFTVVVLVLIDQCLKLQFQGSQNVTEFGPFNFHFVGNYGLSFGQLSDTHPLVRTVLVSTLYGLIVMAFLVAVFFLWTNGELFFLRFGLTLFFSGITGNAIDRIRLGYAIDFVELKSTLTQGAIFNFADVVQLTGILITIFSFFYLNQKIWHLNNMRRIKVVNPSFQYAFAFKLTTIGVCSSTLIWVFGHSLMVALIPDSTMKQESLHIFNYGSLLITLAQSVILFLFGIIFSHRISGPIYALGKFVGDLLSGDNRELKLRSNDYHPEIVKIAQDIKKLSKCADQEAK